MVLGHLYVGVKEINGREYKKIKSVIAVESVKHKSYVIIYEKFLQQVFG
jgi:hypothetical protein